MTNWWVITTVDNFRWLVDAREAVALAASTAEGGSCASVVMAGDKAERSVWLREVRLKQPVRQTGGSAS